MAFLIAVCVSQIQADECHLTPVIHKLHYPGCQEKRIPSYACVGRCTSYVKVSGSKIWQAERSCMCCQESGERVAVVALDCSNSPGPKTREVRGHLEVSTVLAPIKAADTNQKLFFEPQGYHIKNA